MAKKKTILHICAKCSDNCYARLEDKDGNVLKERNYYVPEMMPGQEFGEKPDSHYGDYVILSIDIETGQILNWKKPSEAAIKRFIKTGK
jgi:hypothetical protein